MSKKHARTESPTVTASKLNDLRRDPRYPSQTVVLIYWTDARGFPCDACAVIRDVSARGFGIETDQQFPIGQPLTIRTAVNSLECVVRHLQEYPNSFLAGFNGCIPKPETTSRRSPARSAPSAIPSSASMNE